MRAPLSWIREFTPIEVPPRDIADALDQLGLEVEQVDEPGRDITGVVAARILDVVPHPNADRIRLAAHFGLPLTVPEVEPEPKVDNLAGATVVVEAPDRCPRFVGTVATVTMGESPQWMQRRLTLAGMRPISNVVDVTNYVMLERC